MSLEKFFNPQSIAVVGASETKGKVGNVVAKNLLELGYKGEVFLVNPKHKKLFNRSCYPNLKDIEAKIDLAIIIVPAPLVVDIIKRAKAKVKNYVIISAGFSEIGKEGKERAKKLLKLAQDNDLNILGPNCLGFINPHLKLNASFAGGIPPAGKVALVSQSGALIVALMDMAKAEGLSFSKIISIGNKLQLDEISLLNYLEKDKQTEIVAFYLEGIKRGKEFLKKASKIIKSKPIIALKSGRSEKAQKAISLHTGSLAGSDQIVSAAFFQAGIWRAENIEEFIMFLKAVDLKEKIANEDVAIITNAGGPGVLAADAFQNKKIKLAEFSSDTKKKLKQFLPTESSIENPIDLIGDAQANRYQKVLEILNEEKLGAIIAILTPQGQTPVQEIAQVIVDFSQKSSSSIIPVFIGDEKVKRAKQFMRDNQLTNFDYPEQAIEILNKYYIVNNLNKTRIKKHNFKINKVRLKNNINILQKASYENRKVLYYEEGKKIIESYNMKAAEFYAKIDQVKKFPVVVKIDSPRILHKTDRKGVVLNIKNFIELKEAYTKMKNNFPGEKIIIQPQNDIQQEIILGIKQDAIFGNIVLVGLGGIYTEILHQVEFFIPPLDKEYIHQQLQDKSLGFLFREIRGKKSYNIEELTEIVFNFSQMALELENRIEQVDINPLLIYNNHKKAVAVDIKFLLKD